jgi:hypothetical protein
VVVAAGAWLNTLLGKDLPIKTTPQFVGTYFWKIPNSTALRKYFNPFPTHNKHPPSPTVMILNSPLEEKNEKNGIPKASLYAIPALDYAGEIKVKYAIVALFKFYKIYSYIPLKFGVSYRGEQIEGEIPRNGERVEHPWMWQIPQGHLKHHWPHVDYSEPAHRTTCLYTVMVIPFKTDCQNNSNPIHLLASYLHLHLHILSIPVVCLFFVGKVYTKRLSTFQHKMFLQKFYEEYYGSGNSIST